MIGSLARCKLFSRYCRSKALHETAVGESWIWGMSVQTSWMRWTVTSLSCASDSPLFTISFFPVDSGEIVPIKSPFVKRMAREHRIATPNTISLRAPRPVCDVIASISGLLQSWLLGEALCNLVPLTTASGLLKVVMLCRCSVTSLPGADNVTTCLSQWAPRHLKVRWRHWCRTQNWSAAFSVASGPGDQIVTMTTHCDLWRHFRFTSRSGDFTSGPGDDDFIAVQWRQRTAPGWMSFPVNMTSIPSTMTSLPPSTELPRQILLAYGRANGQRHGAV